MADLNALKAELGKLTVLEIAQLVKDLEKEWGVSAAAAVASSGGGGGAAAAAVEKTEFTVVLKDVGPKKIEVIKVIRQLTTLGLKEAKEMAETASAKVLEAVGKEAAEDAKRKLVEVGATVDVV